MFGAPNTVSYVSSLSQVCMWCFITMPRHHKVITKHFPRLFRCLLHDLDLVLASTRFSHTQSM